MQITYLGHSGFLAETEQAYYLFDYIRGNLPELSAEKPLYILVSHAHEDHFDPVIFQQSLLERADKYLLSGDIRKKWQCLSSDSIEWIARGTACSLKRATVETLSSTDQGVAFVIRERAGRTIYHAGDLHWWHWDGDTAASNRNMEVSFKRQIDHLKGVYFDAAFVPLDPRLENAYWYGMDYFVRQIAGGNIFPMHLWKEYSVISRYLKEHPIQNGKNIRIHQISKENEIFEVGS